MKLRFVNIIVLTIFLGFSVFFGYQNYKTNVENANSDSLFENELSTTLNDITKEIAEDINITNTNRANNDRSGTSTSPSVGPVAVNFTNFHDMYEYAVNKYNKATYVYSSASGTAILDGTIASLGFSLENEKTSLSFIKAKQQNERYFQFSLTGRKILEGYNNLSVSTVHYTNGTIYQYRVGTGDPVVQLTEAQYKERLDWDMTQIFHLPTDEVASTISEEEVISFMYDDTAKEYVAKLEIDTASFQTNFSKIIQSVTNGSRPATFNKIALTIRVDKNGNFKSITYIEDFSASITYNGLSMQGSIKTNYTESFTIIDNGFIEVSNPF